MRQGFDEEVSNESAEDGQTTANPERTGVAFDAVGSSKSYASSFNVRMISFWLEKLHTIDHWREGPNTNKCAYFPTAAAMP